MRNIHAGSKTNVLSLAASLLLATTILAADNPTKLRIAKQAWEWTDDERIAERLNPLSLRERATPEATEPFGAKVPARSSVKGGGSQRQIASNAVADAPPPTIIVGRRNPELFLPIELFPNFVRGAFSDDGPTRQKARSRMNAIIAESMSPDRFWSALESSLADFIENQRAENALFQRLNSVASEHERAPIRKEITNIQSGQCRLKAEALRRGAEAVGRDNLYRVLYRAIAPEITMTSSEPETLANLRWIQRGCR